MLLIFDFSSSLEKVYINLQNHLLFLPFVRHTPIDPKNEKKNDFLNQSIYHYIDFLKSLKYL